MDRKNKLEYPRAMVLNLWVLTHLGVTYQIPRILAIYTTIHDSSKIMVMRQQ